MKHLVLCVWGAFACVSVQAQVQAPVPKQETTALNAYLPAEQAAREALLSSPWMQAARAQKDSWSARAKAIQSGPHEFVLRSTSQRRHDTLMGTRLNESTVSLETPMRFWGKRGVDAHLSDTTQAYADLVYADALHEGSRELIQLWFNHLRALSDAQTASTALQLASQMQRMTQVQLKQGEVSKLDAELAHAEHERTQANLAVAQSQREATAAVLQQRFATLSLPTQLSLANGTNLPALEGNLPQVRQRYVAHNHEINLMRLEAERLRLGAERASRDRLPDPTLGVFSSRDRGGAETVQGLQLSLPLPGAARWHHHTAALADAQSASDKVALLVQQKSAMFDGLWSAYLSKREAALQLNSAAQRQTLAAERSLKAYSLGEGTLADVLLISRMASDNRHAAQRMSLEVAELLALIYLDLHDLWDFD